MRILAAVDLSDATLDARETLAAVAPWAARLGGTVDALYTHAREARPFPDDVPADVAAVVSSAYNRQDEALRPRLQGALDALPDALRGAARIEHGDPWDNLASQAVGYDLVALVTHGRKGIERAWFGSVAERFAAQSPAPTLVLHPNDAVIAADGPLRVLVGLDLREAPDAQWARVTPLLAGLGDARVDAVFSQQDPIWPTGWEPNALSTRVADDWLALVRMHQERLLASMTANLPPEQLGAAHVKTGDPAVELANLSAEYDLVVVGTHGRTGLAHFWHGSVSDRVVRKAKAPVLVVPTK